MDPLRDCALAACYLALDSLAADRGWGVPDWSYDRTYPDPVKAGFVGRGKGEAKGRFVPLGTGRMGLREREKRRLPPAGRQALRQRRQLTPRAPASGYAEGDTRASQLFANRVKNDDLEGILADLPEAEKTRAALQSAQARLKQARGKNAIGADNQLRSDFIDAPPGMTLEEAMRNKVPTAARWKPERVAVHNKIIFDYYLNEENVRRATPPPGVRPRLDFYGGRGGSGKSWFHGREGGVDKEHAIYINSDDIKYLLGNRYPEDAKDADGNDIEGHEINMGSSVDYEGWNNANFHEESSDVSKKLEAVCREMGLNVVFDGTFGSASALPRIKEFRDQGYATAAHYMYLPPEESIKRVIGRYRDNIGRQRGELTEGRYIPPEITFNSQENEKFFDQAVEQGLFDDYRIVDSNVPRGAPRPTVTSKTKPPGEDSLLFDRDGLLHLDANTPYISRGVSGDRGWKSPRWDVGGEMR